MSFTWISRAWLIMVGRTQDPGFSSARFARGPPFGVQQYNKTDAEQVRNQPVNKRDMFRVLAAQMQGFLHIRIMFNHLILKSGAKFS